MTEQEAFIAAICENPKDVFPRGQYADWLEERGDPRGEFIRVQCEIDDYASPKYGVIVCEGKGPPARAGSRKRCKCRPCVLRRRERELLAAWGSYTPWIVPHPDIVLDDYTFRRGFVEHVELSLSDWLDYGPALVQATPLLEVRITDREPADRVSVNGMWYWFRENRNALGDWRDENHLPDAIFNLLLGGDDPDTIGLPYSTSGLASVCLSRACLAWAREQAKLPPLS